MKIKTHPQFFTRTIMMLAISGLAILSISLFQSSLEPAMQKVYSLLALGTSALLGLHYSLLH